MAGRISLVEEYENKDMIVQVKKCLDQTEAAVGASETARDVSIASAAEAHEASTNANSASAQAHTAAQTVSTYESRLGAVENESAGNRSSIQTMDEEITDIHNDLISTIRRVGAVENDLTNVIRKDGDPGQIVYNGLELRGTNRAPDTVVGQLDDRIVNAKRLIEEIDTKLNAYAQMVRTSGNQTVDGRKTNRSNQCFEAANMYPSDGFICKSLSDDVTKIPPDVIYYPMVSWLDQNDVKSAQLRFEHTPTEGILQLVFYVRRPNGSYKSYLVGDNS